MADPYYSYTGGAPSLTPLSPSITPPSSPMDPYYSYTGGAPSMAPMPPVRPRVLRNPAVANPSSHINVPVGQVAQTPQPGNANFWDALRALFSGQQGPSPQGQGMTGLLTPRGRSAPGTDALGNPFNRFG